MAKPIDGVFKELIQTSSLAFIQCQLDETFESITPTATEAVKLVRDADFVYNITQNKQQKILHLEVQTAKDTTMHTRMLIYAGLLFEKHQLPIKQIVLYLGEEPKKEAKEPPMVDTIKMDYFDFHYKLVSITDIHYKKFLERQETLPLAILGKYDPKNVVQVIKEIFERSKKFLRSSKQFLELKINLIILAKLRKFGENTNDTENLIANIPNIQFMFQNIDYTDISVYKEGKLEGKKEGKKEAELETNLKVAKKMLLAKLPIAQIAQITGLTVVQIKKIVV